MQLGLDRDAGLVTKALLVILDAVFSGTVHYANTKIQPLVNNSTLIGSSKMQQYFLKLHPSLNVQRWKLEETLRQRQQAGHLLPPGRPGAVTNSSRGKNIPRLIMAKLRVSLSELANGNQHIESSVLEPDAMVFKVDTTMSMGPLNGLQMNGMQMNGMKDAYSLMSSLGYGLGDDADSVQLLSMKDASSMAEPLNILPTMSMPTAVAPPLPDLEGGGAMGMGKGLGQHSFSWDMTPSIISEPLPMAPSQGLNAVSMSSSSSSAVTGNNVVYIRAYSPYRGSSHTVSG